MKIIKWHKNAKKQLHRIRNAKIENKIYDAVQSLKFFPISIEEVDKRDDRTY